ncbi:MAG: MBOAT family protein [Deltaproteobacteria bacterium]|nr:MBOAT family protein [Deltaproteobacteria bacterium]
MLYNSKAFLAFLAVVLLVYYPLPQRAKLWFLLACSAAFYGFWDPRLLGLLALSTAVDFVAGRQIDRAPPEARRSRTAWLWASLAVNLGMLGFFKYHDFFVLEFSVLLGALGLNVDPEGYLLRLVLPAGISFYTFQTMAYTIDIWRGHLRHEPDPLKFALYVVFFPQLVAGPVERATHLLPQFSRPFGLSPQMVRQGIFLILLGFVKKVVFADRLALAIAPLYDIDALGRLPTSVEAASAQLLFTTQIYVDFSSYSDIAIGLGLLLGYHIRPNFNLPFVVPSIPERWRRWHISMSQWFRDYIFIPLGGSRHGALRTQLNILFLMFLSGLWHGASRNFVVWGLLNGLAMLSHRWLERPLGALRGLFGAHPLSRVAYFYLCCLFTYASIASINIFFRTPDWSTALAYAGQIFGAGLGDYARALSSLDLSKNTVLDDDLQLGFLYTGLIFLAHEGERYLQLGAKITAGGWAWWLSCAGLLWLVVAFGISGPQFIYFQF